MQKPSLVIQRTKPNNNFIPNVEKTQKRVPQAGLIMPDFNTKPSQMLSAQMIMANEVTTIEASVEEIQMNEEPINDGINDNMARDEGGIQLEPEAQVQNEGSKGLLLIW